MDENQYRVLFETSESAIFIASPTGQLVDVNPAWLRLFAYTKQAASQLSLSDLFINAPEADRFRQAIKKQGRVKEFETRCRKGDKSEMDCLVTAKSRQSADGKITGYQGVIRDITQKKTRRATD